MTVLPARRPGPIRIRAQGLACVALVGVGVYVGLDIALAFLRPAYSLRYNVESDYGRGPWAWVMDVNFWVRCVLSVAVAGALHRVVSGDARTRAGLVLLTAWAICSGLLAFFPDDASGRPVHGSGAVHLVLAFVAFTCMAIGALLISVGLRLRSRPSWRSAGSVLLIIAAAGALGYVLLGVAVRHPHAPDGLYERAFLGLELAWITVAAVAVLRRTGLPELSTSQPAT